VLAPPQARPLLDHHTVFIGIYKVKLWNRADHPVFPVRCDRRLRLKHIPCPTATLSSCCRSALKTPKLEPFRVRPQARRTPRATMYSDDCTRDSRIDCIAGNAHRAGRLQHCGLVAEKLYHGRMSKTIQG